jgi:creatinine amidohydrolase
MQLDLATWPEVDAYLKINKGIILPTGSTEQHGPVGLIGTDRICAQAIASQAGDLTNSYVCTALGYTPAPFNMSFPGTLSLRADTFAQVAIELLQGLAHHGFKKIYILNGHGANLEPLRRIIPQIQDAEVQLRSWWDFEPVNAIRRELYGDWEGMHATPAEIAITQALYRVVEDLNLKPPKKLTPEFVKAHAGDKHGPPDEHRAEFPDGRVGSHSSLAKPEHGQRLLHAAAKALADDFLSFVKS